MPRLLSRSWRWIDDERHSLVGHLDGVSVAQLVRREAPANACGPGGAAQLDTRGGGRPWSSSGRAVDDAQQRADRKLEAHIDPPLQVLPGPFVHADLAAAAALAAADQQRSTTVVEVGFVELQRRLDPQARAPQHHDQATHAQPWRRPPAVRITATISSTVGGSAG